MSDGEQSSCVVRTVADTEKEKVATWLLGPDAISTTLARAHPTEPDWLLEALRDDRSVGALWVIRAPGRVATLIGPRCDAAVADAAAVTVGSRLIEEANKLIDRQQIAVAQAILHPDQQSQTALYRAAGYHHIIELDYLVSTGQRSGSSRAGSLQLSYQPVGPPVQDRLLAVVGQTYEGSLDCPALNGVRQLEDVLHGYQRMGSTGDAHWYLIVQRGTDVGCLLLADHPQADSWEIVYLGVVPQQRGRGIGLNAVQHAQVLSQQAGRARLTLAVDATNTPAQRIYQKAGFIRWDRKRVCLRVS